MSNVDVNAITIDSNKMLILPQFSIDLQLTIACLGRFLQPEWIGSELSSAADDPSVSQSVFAIMEEAPTKAFSWLEATSTFTYKALL